MNAQCSLTKREHYGKQCRLLYAFICLDSFFLFVCFSHLSRGPLVYRQPGGGVGCAVHTGDQLEQEERSVDHQQSDDFGGL